MLQWIHRICIIGFLLVALLVDLPVYPMGPLAASDERRPLMRPAGNFYQKSIRNLFIWLNYAKIQRIQIICNTAQGQKIGVLNGYP